MFNVKDTMCRCMCGLMIKTELLMTLYQVQTDYGKPLVILSGARCAKHNEKVGGSKKSAHIEGKAVDVMRSSSLRAFLTKNLEKYNLYMEDPSHTGTDAQGWLHIQIRPTNSGKRIFTP